MLCFQLLTMPLPPIYMHAVCMQPQHPQQFHTLLRPDASSSTSSGNGSDGSSRHPPCLPLTCVHDHVPVATRPVPVWPRALHILQDREQHVKVPCATLSDLQQAP